MEKPDLYGEEYLSIGPGIFEIANPHSLFKNRKKESSTDPNNSPCAEQKEMINQQNVLIDNQEKRLRKLEEKKKSILISRSLFFPSNSALLSIAAQQELTSLSRMLLNNVDIEVRISAFADTNEREDKTSGLRMKRAENAEKFLMQTFGIEGERIFKIADEEIKIESSVQSLNRRVDIELLKEY